MVFVGTDLNFVCSHKKMMNYHSLREKLEIYILNQSSELVRLILEDFDLAYSSILYRSQYLPNTSQFSEDFGKWADRPILISLSHQGKVGIIKEKLINYRIHKEQDSQTDDVDREKVIGYIVRLFNCYKDNLCKNDQKLFYTFTTNNIINLSASLSDNLRTFFRNIKHFKKIGFFKIKFLNYKGVVYMFKSFFKVLFKK